eukprot:CAMPEP_0181188924 /NCGR_PEP_ID=MMETSP1096-20121128/11386_1 /TAXON_ID=156174 ORGANISM="Chrysochromulina ericina, Strain CCMP281" /NCGR_SAMPLE_ID=MMETSP1096 /ASSEMBLY_ACC=CAM_ASM_000453 /LENGTH=100 /DNA_ID=CAMNT_0023278039 /DNA_START=281 /DNA_END=580 /DNA_ORIENTATION=-
MSVLASACTLLPVHYLLAKKESGQPVDEKSVGLPLGSLSEESVAISFGERAQSKVARRARSPFAHASSSHALRPRPKSSVGRTLTANPLCTTQRSATCSG